MTMLRHASHSPETPRGSRTTSTRSMHSVESGASFQHFSIRLPRAGEGVGVGESEGGGVPPGASVQADLRISGRG